MRVHTNDFILTNHQFPNKVAMTGPRGKDFNTIQTIASFVKCLYTHVITSNSMPIIQ
jgi:hypothetical protein